jgi:hypothetical protein
MATAAASKAAFSSGRALGMASSGKAEAGSGAVFGVVVDGLRLAGASHLVHIGRRGILVVVVRLKVGSLVSHREVSC